ncbi:hypothetical protein BsIDN1_56060 [Bacillus safensis]|uniref:Uncharacterized protein n=1 Tax=Bacillus safensis TaxID=561879 RepID=A0A5S9MG14_BACIA|nr:hypothetical protein BsIDN1_56060 [Bacillus safensis]
MSKTKEVKKKGIYHINTKQNIWNCKQKKINGQNAMMFIMTKNFKTDPCSVSLYFRIPLIITLNDMIIEAKKKNKRFKLGMYLANAESIGTNNSITRLIIGRLYKKRIVF